MVELRQYFFALICAAMLCAIISSFVKNSTSKAIIKLMSGMLLTIELIQPFLKADIKFLAEASTDYILAGQTAAEQGTVMAQDALFRVIESELEAYVLEKADISPEDISLEIALNSDYVPTSIRIYGKQSPRKQAQLERILETDLGITKENQIWNGRK